MCCFRRPLFSGTRSGSLRHRRPVLGWQDVTYRLHADANAYSGRIETGYRFGAFNSVAQAPDSAPAIASAELKWLSSFLASVSFQGEFSNTMRSYAGKSFVRYVC